MAALDPEAVPRAVADGPRSLDELDQAIHELAGRMQSASRRLLVMVREFDQRRGWVGWGFRNCAEWLAWRCDFGVSAAREKVRTAHALEHLPLIDAAFADGRVSYSKVRALTRVAQPDDEEALLRYALNATAVQVEERCRQLRNVGAEATDDARCTWERRSLSIWRNGGKGTTVLNGELPHELGQLVEKALDRAVEVGDVARGPEFAKSHWRTQQADALVALAKSYLAGGGVKASSADQYQIVVHVDAAALEGGKGRADLPVETIRRLGCDGSTVALIDNARGEPLAIGRKQRTVSAAIRRALWSRDRGCAFPGCNHTRFVDAHHIRHWSAGGETSLSNLTLLCSHHHRLVHECGYRVRKGSDDAVRFERPDGNTIPAQGFGNPSAEGPSL